jgi:hypothetical protein
MTGAQYQELLKLVRGRAGDAFRAAIQYDERDWTVLYIRDDVATAELKDALDTLLERVRDSEPIVDSDVYRGVGKTQATVELHADAALIHLRESDTDGVVISLDREIAQGLGSFINRCNSILSEG